MNNEVVKKPSLQEMIVASTKELGNALPAHMTPERLVRIALTCIRTNPKLANCTPESFLGALFTSAQLGLEPVAGRAYLIPFRNRRNINGTWVELNEVQFIIGYQGLIDLFYRNERSLSIQAHVVCKNDFFEYELGTNAKIIHRPAKNERGEKIYYYAIATMINGGSMFEVMSRDEVVAHSEHYSKQFDHSKNKWGDKAVWVNEFDEMAKKTVIKRLAKVLPLSIELRRAIQQDESSREFKSGIKNILDMPSTSFESVDDIDDNPDNESKRSKKEQALIDAEQEKKEEALKEKEKDDPKDLAKKNKNIIDIAQGTWMDYFEMPENRSKSKVKELVKDHFGIELKDYADITVEQAKAVADMLIKEMTMDGEEKEDK